MAAVNPILRRAGIATAGVWLGGSALYALGIDPLFGKAELLRLLGPLHAGEVGLVAAERFHMFQVLCSSAAVIITLAEWLYSGRPLDKRILCLLFLFLALGSAGRLWAIPRCRDLNARAYLGPARQVLREALTPAQRQAEHSLAVWSGLLVVFNVAAVCGSALYFIHAVSPAPTGPRLYSRNRLRI